MALKWTISHLMMIKDDSPAAIVEVLGQRLKQARLNADITQTQLADRAGISKWTVINAEKGKTTLETFVALLQALEQSGQVDNLLPPQELSPMQLLKLQGRARQRASGKRKKKVPNSDGELEW
jgi:putative transcriptional regulator